MEKVKVVVPVYTAEFRDEELRSLRQTARVLGNYPLVVIAPEGTDTSVPEQIFGGCTVIRVGDEWLGRRNGIAGYNAMMTSRRFYDLFADTEYILICQSDAWIFRDELKTWCNKGYDYVGAPFPRKPLYNLLPIRWYLALRRLLSRQILRQDLMGRVYNGGLSLRHVSRFAHACDQYSKQINHFLSNKHHLHNEDVFWSLVPENFRYPTTDEALEFSFDTKPAYCYYLTSKRLPFGCHGWFKESVSDFWKDIIE